MTNFKTNYTREEVVNIIDDLLQRPHLLEDATTNENTDYDGEELLKIVEQPKTLEAKKLIVDYESEQLDEPEACPTCGDIDGMVNPCCAGYDPLHYKNCGYG